MIRDKEMMPNQFHTAIVYSYSFVCVDLEPIGGVDRYMDHMEIKVASSLLKSWMDCPGCYL